MVASAGARKTTFIVEQSLKINSDSRVLILAYTNNTLRQIKKYITERTGAVSENISIQSWHSFLLTECIKPYQNFVYDKKRIQQIFYPEDSGKFKEKRRFIRKANIEAYFLIDSTFIISDHLSEFALLCNAASVGLVMNRLEQIYDYIFIDESQDLAGYDFEVVEELLKSSIVTTLVGDCRQATYFTNNSSKYKKYKGDKIVELFKVWEKNDLCELNERNECYRCNQYICDFADRLYPQLITTVSKEVEETDHDGIFIINESEVATYFKIYKPIILRESIKTKTLNYQAFNFGAVKGLSFNRILIFPNGPIKEYLKNGNPDCLKPITKAKFYVGITRARNSVAIVYNGKTFF